MALKLNLKANERLIVSGAVLRNGSTKSTVLYVENTVPILREKDIMTEADACTPCRKVYFTIQLMYIDNKNLTEYHKHYWNLVHDIIVAAPSMNTLIEQISDKILTEDYYLALKLVKKLIDYEEELLTNAKSDAKSN